MGAHDFLVHQCAGVSLYMLVKTGKGLSLNTVPFARMLYVIQRLETSQAWRHVCVHDDRLVQALCATSVKLM